MAARKPEKVIAKALSELASAGHHDRLALARTIAAAADELERVVVLEARAAGATWTQIGHAFGMSKQASQQRFRRKQGKHQ